MALFWGLVIWLITTLVRGSGSSEPRQDHETPEQILRRRFAAGEIDEAEFLHHLDVLRDQHQVAI